jgi:putative transcriptional regulator
VPRLALHVSLAQRGIDLAKTPDAPIHFGGPVDPQRGIVLHGQASGAEDRLHVGRRWALSGTPDVLRAIAEGRGPSRWLVALGYAGWGEGQLDRELTRHGRFATRATTR